MAREGFHWVVELLDGRGFECVHADRVRIDGGALVFTDGEGLLDATFVAAFGPGRWAWVAEAPLPDGGEQ